VTGGARTFCFFSLTRKEGRWFFRPEEQKSFCQQKEGIWFFAKRTNVLITQLNLQMAIKN
jgi:hypothetical protein